MSPHTDVSSMPIRGLLFDPGTDVHRVIAGAVGRVAAESRELGALLARTQSPGVVVPAIAQTITATLSRSGPGLAVEVLVTVRELVDAGRATSRDPDLTVTVPLRSYRLSRRETQTVQVTAGSLQAHVVCDLDVVFDLEPVNATVAQGRLIQLGDARCLVTASLAVANREVVRSRPRTIMLGAHVQLGHGVPLVPFRHAVSA